MLPPADPLQRHILRLRWRLERAWWGGRLRWGAWLAAIVAGSTGLAMSGFLFERLETMGHSLENRLATLTAHAPVSVLSQTPESPDFVRKLAAPPATSRVIEELQRSSAQAAVVLMAVQVRDRPATAEQLGRTEIAVNLRGTYQNTMLVLKEATDRFQNLTVQRLRLQRLRGPADVETAASLSLWAPPLSEGR